MASLDDEPACVQCRDSGPGEYRRSPREEHTRRRNLCDLKSGLFACTRPSRRSYSILPWRRDPSLLCLTSNDRSARGSLESLVHRPSTPDLWCSSPDWPSPTSCAHVGPLSSTRVKPEVLRLAWHGRLASPDSANSERRRLEELPGLLSSSAPPGGSARRFFVTPQVRTA